MLAHRPPRTARPAFTLIELLVVISIIAVLVSLLLSGVMAAWGVQYRTHTQYEIQKMTEGLQGAMAGFPGKPQTLPSQLLLYNDLSNYTTDTTPVAKRSAQALRQMFGIRLMQKHPTTGKFNVVNWDGSGSATAKKTLEGHQCLVFYLGGVPSTSGGLTTFQGFSTDPINPMATGGDRYGPYFDFKPTRLVGTPFFSYLDPYGKQPYAYFSTNGSANNYNATSPGDCPTLGLMPYQTSATAFANPSTFQIISAGKDWKFGTGGTVWNPSAGSSDIPTMDNITNFSKSLLAAPQS